MTFDQVNVACAGGSAGQGQPPSGDAGVLGDQAFGKENGGTQGGGEGAAVSYMRQGLGGGATPAQFSNMGGDGIWEEERSRRLIR